MENTASENRYKVLAKAIFLLTAIALLVWFLSQIIEILLLFLFAVILALVLNAPTIFLESKGLPRTLSAIIMVIILIGGLVLLGWLIIPTLSDQLSGLVKDLPDYVSKIQDQLGKFLHDYPEVHKNLKPDSENISKMLPSLPALLRRVGRYSFSVITIAFLFVILLSMVVYMLIKPRPLLETYITVFPPHLRDKAANALSRVSEMLIGWIWSNVITGGIEAVLSIIFLSVLNVPGAFIWGILAFFAELVPKIGLYIMALPPVLLALTISPITALWVALFYIVLTELMGDLVVPRIRASTMNIHPVFTLLIMLAMGSALGIWGALIATPLAAIIKTYYEEFYLSKYPEDKQTDKRIEKILYRK